MATRGPAEAIRGGNTDDFWAIAPISDFFNPRMDQYQGRYSRELK